MIPLSYNLRSLAVRRSTTIATGLGIGLVVFMLAAALMLSAGIQRTLVSAGRTDNAIVLRKGSDGELTSGFDTNTVKLILNDPRVKRRSGDAPLGAGELVVVLALEKLGGEQQIANVQVRGISDASLALRDDVRVIAGHAPRPGTDEVMLGRAIVGRFANFEVGKSFELKKNRPLKVVGVFEAQGSSLESEAFTNLETLQTSFGREGLVSSVTVRLTSPTAFEAFRANMETDKQLGLEAARETSYYAKQSSNTSLFVRVLGILTAGVVAVGATIGAVITMSAAVAQRRREIGTLRALGFPRTQVLISFLFEALALAFSGGLVGLGAAMLLTFAKFSMMNFATWQEITFKFVPAPDVVFVAIAAGCGMGVLGGFLPALRASRVSVIDALRG